MKNIQEERSWKINATVLQWSAEPFQQSSMNDTEWGCKKSKDGQRVPTTPERQLIDRESPPSDESHRFTLFSSQKLNKLVDETTMMVVTMILQTSPKNQAVNVHRKAQGL